MHTPVLLQETVDALEIQPGGKYIDATYGLGGHSSAILERGGIVLALDWDSDSLARQKINNQSLTVINGNYADIKDLAQKHHFVPCQGIVFDLGLSMEQIRLSGRGFSYEKGDEPLDMRISSDLELTAAKIINSCTIEQLYEIFARNAEELNSRTIAQAINRSRHVSPIQTVNDLINSISTVTKNKSAIARIFQALRMEVNNELENIKKGLEGAMAILVPGGKIAIISFHPTEDRVIKQFIRQHDLKTLKKPITATDPQSFERSAKLRIIIKN